MPHPNENLFNACIKALEDLAPNLPEKDRDYVFAFTSCAKTYVVVAWTNPYRQRYLLDLLAKHPLQSGKATNLLKKIIAQVNLSKL